MTLLSGPNPSQYLGVRAPKPVNQVTLLRPPTLTDWQNFDIGDFWYVNNPALGQPQQIWTLVKLAFNPAVGSQQGTWVQLYPNTAAGSIITLTGDQGGPVSPDGGGNIDIVGDGIFLETIGNPGANEISIQFVGDNPPAFFFDTIPATDVASPDNTGTIHLEGLGGIVITAGTDTIQIDGSGAGGTVNSLTGDAGGAVGPDGTGTIFVLGDGVFTTFVGNGNPNELKLDFSAPVAIAFDVPPAIGQAVPTAAGLVHFAGLGGIVITTAANTITINGTGAGGGVTTFHTDSGDATVAANAITIAGGFNIATTGAGSTVTVNVADTTDHAVQVGNAVGALTSISVGLTNQALLGVTGADPVFGAIPNGALVNNTITLNNGANITVTGSPVALGGAATIAVSGTTNHSLLVGNLAGSIGSLGVAGNGFLPIGSAGVDPVLAQLTAGANITITNLPGAIVIASTGGGGAFAWTEILVMGPTAMAVNNGYIANNAGLVSLLLPAVSPQGSIIRVVGKGAGGWRVTQNAGQTIYFGIATTTPGVGGSVSSTRQRDCIEMLCITANTEFQIIDAVGDLNSV